jgi:hypothetical protein
VPTSFWLGVPVMRPLDVLNVAQLGKLIMLNVSDTLSGFVTVGAKLNPVPATIDAGGVPLIDQEVPPPPPPSAPGSSPPPPQPAASAPMAKTASQSGKLGRGRAIRAMALVLSLTGNSAIMGQTL